MENKTICSHKAVSFSKKFNKWCCPECFVVFKNLEEWRKQKNERITDKNNKVKN